MYTAVTDSRQYYSSLILADFQNCQQGTFTIFKPELKLYDIATPLPQKHFIWIHVI
jgi:hypothetical protein